MGIGKRIKDIIIEKRITVKELSEKTNIPASTLYSIVKRDNDTVQTDILQRIAVALDVTPVELIWGFESESKENNKVQILDKQDLKVKDNENDICALNDARALLDRISIENDILDSDNKERHHLLIHYYNQLDQLGRDALIELLYFLNTLNDLGIKETLKRVEELTLIPKYTNDINNNEAWK